MKRAAAKILLVDDNLEMTELIAEILQLSADVGEVQTSNQPEAALKLIMNDDFDLVITDYSMPGMTGVELVKALRDLGNKVRILVFSVRMDESIFMEFEQGEIQGTISKNSSIDLIHMAVHEILNNRSFFRLNRAG